MNSTRVWINNVNWLFTFRDSPSLEIQVKTDLNIFKQIGSYIYLTKLPFFSSSPRDLYVHHSFIYLCTRMYFVIRSVQVAIADDRAMVFLAPFFLSAKTYTYLVIQFIAYYNNKNKWIFKKCFTLWCVLRLLFIAFLFICAIGLKQQDLSLKR